MPDWDFIGVGWPSFDTDAGGNPIGSGPSSYERELTQRYGYLGDLGESGTHKYRSTTPSRYYRPGTVRVDNQTYPYQGNLGLTNAGISTIREIGVGPIRSGERFFWGMTTPYIRGQSQLLELAKNVLGAEFVKEELYALARREPGGGAYTGAGGQKIVRESILNMRRQTQDFFSMMYGRTAKIFFKPDIQSILVALDAVDEATYSYFWSKDTMRSLEFAATHVLVNVLKDACAWQDSSPGGWPPLYTELLLSVASQAKINIKTSQKFIYLELDLEKNLGDSHQLTQGFHYQALLKEGSIFYRKKMAEAHRREREHVGPQKRVTLPNIWKEGDLLNPVSKRYKFFRSVISKNAYSYTPQTFWDKTQMDLDAVPTYEDTIRARVNLWFSMKKAPIWLLLYFGTKFPPVIKRYPIIREFELKFQVVFMQIITQKLNQILALINARYAYDYRMRGFREGTWIGGRDFKPSSGAMKKITAKQLASDLRSFSKSPTAQAKLAAGLPWEGRFGKPRSLSLYRKFESTDLKGNVVVRHSWKLARNPKEYAEAIKSGWSGSARIRMPDGTYRFATSEIEMNTLVGRGGVIVQRRGRSAKGASARLLETRASETRAKRRALAFGLSHRETIGTLPYGVRDARRAIPKRRKGVTRLPTPPLPVEGVAGGTYHYEYSHGHGRRVYHPAEGPRTRVGPMRQREPYREVPSRISPEDRAFQRTGTGFSAPPSFKPGGAAASQARSQANKVAKAAEKRYLSRIVHYYPSGPRDPLLFTPTGQRRPLKVERRRGMNYLKTYVRMTRRELFAAQRALSRASAFDAEGKPILRVTQLGGRRRGVYGMTSRRPVLRDTSGAVSELNKKRAVRAGEHHRWEYVPQRGGGWSREFVTVEGPQIRIDQPEITRTGELRWVTVYEGPAYMSRQRVRSRRNLQSQPRSSRTRLSAAQKAINERQRLEREFYKRAANWTRMQMEGYISEQTYQQMLQGAREVLYARLDELDE